MRGVFSAFSNKAKKKALNGLAYYPLGFYFGFGLLIVAGFLYWAQVDLGWEFDWLQLRRWITNNLMGILIVFSALLGLILIASAVAYKKVVDLTEEDYNLWLHQKATRVLFPMFTPLHDWIRIRSRLYHWWHAQTLSNYTHYFLLAISIIALGRTTLSYISSAQASHGCSDTVTITANTTWSTNQCHGDVVIRNNATLTINGGLTAELSSLSVGSDSPAENGFLVVKGDTLNNLGVTLEVDGNVYVRSGSSISGDSQGYAGGDSGSPMGKGPGGGSGNSTHQAGSGAYGGNGGDSDSANNPGGTYYGSLNAPDDLGSGGGFATGCCSNAGGAGGGALKIDAPTGTVTISGTITMNGGNGGAGCCVYGGGGSGGSVWIIADALAGNGTVRANGGTHGSGVSGGAGGRIRIEHNSVTGTLTKQAFGAGTGSWARGGAGTILTDSELLLANNSASTQLSKQTVIDEDVSAPTTTIRDAAHIYFSDETLTFNTGATTIQNNVVFSIRFNNITWTGTTLTTLTGTNYISISPSIVNRPSFTGNISVSNTLSHWWNSTAHDYSLILETDGNFTVESGATINLNGKGFSGGAASNNGNGPGAGGTPSTSGVGAGAGYGGDGDDNNAAQGVGSGTPGSAYGSITDPTNLGSGGGGGKSGSCCVGAGGAGGGSMIASVGGVITLTGTISANGDNGESQCCAPGGGGSGGTINLAANSFSGSGSLTANGGVGGCYSFGCAPGGGGAGGRMKLSYNSGSISSTKQAFGGQSGNSCCSNRGGAGTIVTSDGLIIANNSTTTLASPDTPLTASSYSFASTTISNYATVLFGENTSYSGGALSISNASSTGSVLLKMSKNITSPPTFTTVDIAASTNVDHPAHSDTHIYSMQLNATGNVTIAGTISLSGKGYAGGTSTSNTGKGTGGGVSANGTYGGGGGYGGNGGRGTVSASAGGPVYGTVLAPSDLGSGGGYSSVGCCTNNGGAGGGAVKIITTGNVTVSGSINVNGANGGAGGSGSGGSIWLEGNTLLGAGSILANGGAAAYDSSSSGGWGAGGRIRLNFTADSSTTSKQAFGGFVDMSGTAEQGTIPGGTGTISTATELLIGGHTSSTVTPASTELTETSYSYSNFTVKDRAVVHLGNNSTLAGGTTTLQNNAAVRLLGNNSVWSGGALTTQTNTNTIDVPPGIVTRPSFSSISVASGTLNHTANTTADSYHLILSASGNITLTGSIDVSGRGYSGGGSSANGNGPGGGTGSASSTSGGGGHGGAGGNGTAQGVGGSTYGSAVIPVTLGSGGGSGANGVAGSGGGAVELYSGGTIAVNSSINASGTNGSAGCCSYLAGGGAGGSIMLAGSTISGSSALTANGGNGTGQFGVFSGCGGGGRIARHYTSSTYSGSVSVVKGGGNCTTGQDGTNQTIGAVTNYLVSGHTSPVVAGTPGSITVVARDVSNNQNVAYTGTVTFGSTDTQATLPANYTFTIQDAGSKTFTNGITLKTAGTRSVSVTQQDNQAVTGSQTGIVVNAGSAATLTVTGIDDPISAGTADSAVVTVKDAYNNTATGYTGTVTFSSTDTQATLPANYTFVGGDAGVKTFTNGVTLKSAGEQTLTATDTLTGSITGTQSAITVNAGSIDSLALTGITSPTTAGTAQSPVVTAKDAFNNIITTYAGTIAFSSTDAQAALPANYTFTGTENGTKTFGDALTFKTSGTHSVTVTDGTKNGNANGIVVTAGTPSQLKVGNVTSPTNAGDKNSATVTVQDEFNNTVTGYTGTIAFSSSDSTATLPANYTFTASDQGIHIFSNLVTFNTAGTQSLTATDTGNSTVKGTLSGILVVAQATTPPTENPTVTIPSLTVIFTSPSTGTFTGTIEQEVNGILLDVVITGTIKGNTVTGTVSGTYGSEPVTGSISGTIKGKSIDSALITLMGTNNSDINLSVIVSGVISSPSTPVADEPCKMRGTLEMMIDGKKFSGEVQLTLASDGTVTGSAKGFLDNKRVFGRFSATKIQGEIVGGQVTLTQTGKDDVITGEIIGTVDDGEIVLSNVQHCNFLVDVDVDTDGDGDSNGSGTGSVVVDDPVTGSDTINGGVNIVIEDNQTKTDTLTNGTFETLVANIVVKPSGLSMTTIEQNELISDALAVVSGVALLPTIPALQNIILTSSTRGVGLFQWFFFGYVPRKKRKYWGTVKDRTTSAPIAAILVKLLHRDSGQEARTMRTDQTGRYGFLIDQPGEYQIHIKDPLYDEFHKNNVSIENLNDPIVTGDIVLDPIADKRARLLSKAQYYLAGIKVLNLIHWPILIAGTALSIWLVIESPTLIRTLVAGLYGVLWVSKFVGYRRERHYGIIQDSHSNPISRAVIQLTTKTDGVTAHVHSTVTDKYGRFVLLIKPGVYEIIVAKDGFKTRHGAVIADEANMIIKLERV